MQILLIERFSRLLITLLSAASSLPRALNFPSCQRTKHVAPPRGPTAKGVGASALGRGCVVPASWLASPRPWRPVWSCAGRGASLHFMSFPSVLSDHAGKGDAFNLGEVQFFTHFSL